MKKKERLEASELILTTPCTSDRFELRLPCGMLVRCDNDIESRKSMAAKFVKGTKLPPNAGNLLKRKLWR